VISIGEVLELSPEDLRAWAHVEDMNRHSRQE
jgi:hypothetical protein